MSGSEITIVTDGACESNPGPGGVGRDSHVGRAPQIISGGLRHTTNNRMELRAVIENAEGVEEGRGSG